MCGWQDAFRANPWSSAYGEAVRARAPASAANLGPGFDTLALALDLYVEVEVEPAPRLNVRSEGEGAGLAEDAFHLAARVAIDVAGHDRLAITVRSQIPVARGLGSSAALAVAAAAAAGSTDPLAVGKKVDGHPENAAASTLGGLVGAAMVRGKVEVARMPLDPELMVIAAVPDKALPTAKARQALPSQFSREDVTFSLGRCVLLLAGLADRRALVREATEDRLHQDYRSPLFPEAPQLLSALQEGGALASCWSGAGPTILGFCTQEQARFVETAAQRAMSRAGLDGRVLVLRPDRAGLVTGDGARLPKTPFSGSDLLASRQSDSAAGPAAGSASGGGSASGTRATRPGFAGNGTEPGSTGGVFDFDQQS